MDCSSKEKFPVSYYNRMNELEWSCAAASRLIGVSASLAKQAPVGLWGTARTHPPLTSGLEHSQPAEPRQGQLPDVHETFSKKHKYFPVAGQSSQLGVLGRKGWRLSSCLNEEGEGRG